MALRLRKSTRLERHNAYNPLAFVNTAARAANKIGAWYKKTQGARSKQKTKARSASRTAQRNKIKTGRIVAEGTGGQYSSFNFQKFNYLEKSIDRTIAPTKTTFNNAGQILSAIGKQNIQVVLSAFSQGEIATLYSDIFGATKMDRFLLKKCQAKAVFSNIYLSNVTVDLYDVVARKDVGPSAIADPVTAWAQGDIDSGTSSAYTSVGATPFQTEVFNQYFKVMQTTRMVLGAGQQHAHHVNIDPHRLMTWPYWNYTANGFADLTYYLVVVIHGAPANDTITQTQVTVGQGGLNFIYEKEYTTSVVYYPTAQIKTHNSLLTAFSNAEQTVNVGGTTIVTDAEG
jgi:hypothetical protein